LHAVCTPLKVGGRSREDVGFGGRPRALLLASGTVATNSGPNAEDATRCRAGSASTCGRRPPGWPFSPAGCSWWLASEKASGSAGLARTPMIIGRRSAFERLKVLADLPAQHEVHRVNQLGNAFGPFGPTSGGLAFAAMPERPLLSLAAAAPIRRMKRSVGATLRAKGEQRRLLSAMYGWPRMPRLARSCSEACHPGLLRAHLADSALTPPTESPVRAAPPHAAAGCVDHWQR
jgi:hypothetical protein